MNDEASDKNRIGKRIGELALGHTVNSLILGYAFGYGHYSFATWKLGFLKGDVPACMALSVLSDPFITTACLRRGAFNGMTPTAAGRDFPGIVGAGLRRKRSLGGFARACFIDLVRFIHLRPCARGCRGLIVRPPWQPSIPTSSNSRPVTSFPRSHAG
jgi:hypothetical protein